MHLKNTFLEDGCKKTVLGLLAETTEDISERRKNETQKTADVDFGGRNGALGADVFGCLR